MDCQACGSSNADHVYYCGNCGAELSRSTEKRDVPHVTESKKLEDRTVGNDSVGGPSEVDPAVSQRALVAIAINVRRLFLVALLSIFMVVFSNLASITAMMWFVDRDYSVSFIVTSLLAGAVVLLVVGIAYIVFRKKLTAL